MSIHHRCTLITVVIVLPISILPISIVSSYAGPCSPDIERMQGSVEAMAVATAAAGPAGRQSTAAMTHRQPTPGSVAEATSKVDEAARAKRAQAAIAQARAADSAGDRRACERALSDVRRETGQ